ncbi:MAG: AAA family ATPase, partial [Acidimicrobiales bacterium]
PPGGGGARHRPPPLSSDELLEAFGAADLAGRVCASLSPGTRQLVAVIAGVAPLPGLLLLDEPTSRLEPAARDQVLAAIATVTARFGTTVVLVTHDPVVAGAVGRAVTIRDGRIGAEGLGDAEYAVVAVDGSLQLPADALGILPPGSLVRVVLRGDHVELREP